MNKKFKGEKSFGEIQILDCYGFASVWKQGGQGLYVNIISFIVL